jgi:hypothetical protein
LLDKVSALRSPLVVGVSGHRNLDPSCKPRLAEQVRAFLEYLKGRLPQTEIRIMTGMAQGADLLVAELALQAGLHIDAILPMPLGEYLVDFDAESATSLTSLLRHERVHCFELRLPASKPAATRDALYANLTDTLIDKCSLLLALWDGQASPLPGGTADTVLRYLSARTHDGSSDLEIVMVPAGSEPVWGEHFVYWISTSRTTDTATPARLPSYLTFIGENLLAVHENTPPELDLQVAGLNEYNAEFESLCARKGMSPVDSLMSALPQAEELARNPALRLIDAEYGKADALAIHNQKLSDRLFLWFSWMAFAMASVFLVYAKLLDSGVLLYIYLTILVASLGMFYLIRGHQWFAKHLIYRVLAETMRTKFFLRVAGADRMVGAAELMKLSGINQFSGFGWIGAILKNVQPLDPEQGGAMTQDPKRLAFVHQHWIRGQQSYFKTRVGRLERTHRRLEVMKRWLIYAIAILALVLVGFADSLRSHQLGSVSLEEICIFLMGLLPVWLGIWELYQNKMATRELLWQYRNQLSHFSRAQVQLTRSSALHPDSSILAEVGKESLMESYLWTIHRYHREHEPPAAG